ncbi:hypothetical protein [Rathayibacter iranicus]|uniref:Uncharacterized protein n=2 Tax=Rathayibacter iranicus TaxID=59737 RepID=A0AAD1ACJ3_9MICO|nr:hypothetical protein [Rathayibacter iranicus]AZZ55727.1 hypothetical protein C7V51_07425 [Rathayibacter iranicus]MWV32089.1 hypothetical protein [Rathayibacter iranicus NCPPB 2253 = VKM Ac-1602]PPI60598.1 hypothetical protein C5E08_07390 [Rathayibacter iranicus]PWJ61836.1 hypothetical protein B0H03_11437 [Rathayibacter iranicus NCPPB 2253 = VKM Ac-1602]
MLCPQPFIRRDDISSAPSADTKTERRELSLVPLLVITAVLLAGAVITTVSSRPPTEENPMNPQEGRATIVDIIVSTSQKLDVRGWWPRSGAAAPSTCTLPDETRGASYDFDLWAPRERQGENEELRAEQRERDAQIVADYWTELGMTTRIAATPTRFPTVYATGGPIRSASFDTGAAEHAY